MQYLKAIYAALSTGLGAVAAAYAEGNGHIGWGAGIAIGVSVVGSLGVVWGVPNVSVRPEPPAA